MRVYAHTVSRTATRSNDKPAMFRSKHLSRSQCVSLSRLLCTAPDNANTGHCATQSGSTYSHYRVLDQNVSLHVTSNTRFAEKSRGRESSVGISTRHGLDGPGIESRWRRNFPHPFRPVLRPTHNRYLIIPGWKAAKAWR